MIETVTDEQPGAEPGAPILSPEAILESDSREREWVTLRLGRVCIWELSVPEMIEAAEKSSRPKIDPRGGVDPTESALWQVMLSCYNGDGPEARRIFDSKNGRHVQAILKLGSVDFRKLMETIARVNGASEVEMVALEDFTKATTAATS